MDRHTGAGRRGAKAFAACLAAALLAGAGAARAADTSLSAPLCAVLKKLLPQVKNYRPEGAQSQLVMEIAEAFEYDAAKLRQVKAGIDPATSAACPKDREAMLAILKTKSLAEAVR